MNSYNYVKKECSVHIVTSETKTNIRRFENENGVYLQHSGTNHDGGESIRIEFRDGDTVLATSEPGDVYPLIGLDFTWTYIEKFNKIKSVYLYFNRENWSDKIVKLRSNGDVHVSPCDEKEYTEKDVITMLSYAVAHDKVTSKEMKQKVSEILNWFKDISE
jgi:hypothetical protein